MPTPAIATHNLRKVFNGNKVAVANLSLTVERGEVFGFLGPNGAGKTTSVKMLLGLISPTAGSGTLLNAPLGDHRGRVKVGFLPEHFRFHDWLTASEFLTLHAELYHMDLVAIQKQVPELLARVALAAHANKKLRTFSKGMLQRVGLAQALLNQPELVFLDEPTSGLDPVGRRMVRDIIKDLQAEGTTVFLNSHFLSEVEITCDRVAFIREGTIVRVASLDELEQERVQITLRVGQPTRELVATLAHFGDDVTMDDNSGRIHLTLTGEHRIPDLVAWLVDQGQAVYELSPKRLSLEDQFLEIIGDEMYDS